MPTSITHPRGRVRAQTIRGLATASVLGLSVLATTPASAHNVLIDTEPAEGETVTTQPGTVELVFDQAVQDQDDFNQVVVLNSQEQAFHQGAPQIDHNVVTVDVHDMPDGDYSVSYRIVSADGHPVDGSFDFTMATGEDVEPPAQEPEAETQEPASESTTDVAVPLLSGVVVIGLIAALAVLTLRNRRRLHETTRHSRDADGEDTPDR